ncbi:hypothetical protein DUI87_18111 [Hirundo rustica rustica]|uniref:Uncharacterized protein n=1 Tax=Hirundo rustica rustica TaxID=333673 RepID=A0A3M0JW13_HIRRU|nr:hypothetical protein DUI87_18111 [Hirundo rustica rustica]
MSRATRKASITYGTKKKTIEDVGLLLKGAGVLVTQDMDKAEVLNVFFTSAFVKKTIQEPPENSMKDWSKKFVPWWKRISIILEMDPDAECVSINRPLTIMIDFNTSRSVYVIIKLLQGLVPIIFLMEIPSHVSAKTQNWNSKDVCQAMPYQNSGDFSMEPGS